MFNDLKKLSDPTNYKNLINLNKLNKKELIGFLKKMLLIRNDGPIGFIYDKKNLG